MTEADDMVAQLSLLLLLFPAPRDPEPDDKGKGFFGVGASIDNNGLTIAASNREAQPIKPVFASMM